MGAVTFTFTADNGTEDATDDVTGESEPYTVTAGESLALVIPGGSSIVTIFAAMGVVSGIKKRSRPEWLIN